MVTWMQMADLFTAQMSKNRCLEIRFLLSGNHKFDDCWMGKMWAEDEEKNVYWFGLTADGSNVYDYDSFDELVKAPVFDGRSLIDVWNQIVIEEIDGCDPVERLSWNRV